MQNMNQLFFSVYTFMVNEILKLANDKTNLLCCKNHYL